MTLYTVHIPPAASRSEGLERAVLVKEGFSWPAFVFSFLWLLRHRLWLAALGFALIAGTLTLLAGTLPVPEWTGALLDFLLMLTVGFEGPTVRRMALERRGYRFAGVFGGQDQEEAERKAFQSLAAMGEMGPPRGAAATVPPRHGGPAGVIGLFPDPGAPR